MTEKGTSTGPYRVQLHPSGRTFTARADRTLLASAAAAGFELPSSCRNGTCRTCLRVLHAGSVRYQVDWPGLLPEEKTGGWVLPCVALPLSDLVLDEGDALRPAPQ
jgi:ferredoxin